MAISLYPNPIYFLYGLITRDVAPPKQQAVKGRCRATARFTDVLLESVNMCGTNKPVFISRAACVPRYKSKRMGSAHPACVHTVAAYGRS